MREPQFEEWSFCTPTKTRSIHNENSSSFVVPQYARLLRATAEGFISSGAREQKAFDFSDALGQGEFSPCDSIQNLIEELDQLYSEYNSDGWYGEGSIGISMDTYLAAKRFILAHPTHLPLPTITPEPDGHINFEWYRSTRLLLNVSLDCNGRIYWAALFNSEDPRGTCQFSGEFPQTIAYFIQRIF